MAEPPHVPNHFDAASRWLAEKLTHTAKSPVEELLAPQAIPGKNWLNVRQRLEVELARYVVRPPR